jgi:uncharacterized membrane protein YphA (DoxX/SURF4 family)
VGLLLLRIAVGVTAIIHGAAYLNNRAYPMILDWLVGLILIATATLVLVGFLTPVMGTFTGIGMISTSFPHLPESMLSVLTLLDSKPSAILPLTMAVAIVLLGPGAFSLDARLFGRREIIIPPSLHRFKRPEDLLLDLGRDAPGGSDPASGHNRQ